MERSTEQGRIFGTVTGDVTVFETMRAEASGRITLWPLHLGRLRRNCAALGFPLDEAQLQVVMSDAPAGQPQRLKLSVNRRGDISLVSASLPAAATNWTAAMSDRRIDSADPWLTIKSSHRVLYDAARAELAPDLDEILFCNERGEVCEGTISNLFLERNGRYLTPALSCGLLPGVLRQSLLDAGRAQEAILTPGDLVHGQLYCGNALRGLIRVTLSG